MRTGRLPSAIVAALCFGSVSTQATPAVTLNPLGLGQVLLYPYYTVNGGNDTYLSVVNTTNRGKAVAVRFMEGRNSREVLDFSIYLSAFDVWSGALISLDANGPANLLTRDASCTVPDIKTNANLGALADGTHYVPFRNFGYSGLQNDNGGSAVTRTREGHLEMIEMGVLNPGPAATQVEEEVTHVSASGSPNSGTPPGCTQVVNNWLMTGGAWGDSSTGNRQLDIGLPGGGLYGEAVIINVANGTLHAYSADAIEGFYGGTAAPGGLHFAPASGRTTLADASNGGTTIDSLVTTINGGSVRSTWNIGATPDAVSAVLMQDAIYNEFNTEVALGASSEWVVTFPTKHFYADLAGTQSALPPFTNRFRDDGKACEAITASFWDREELPRLGPTSDCVPPPGATTCVSRPQLCYSAQVETINQVGVDPDNLAPGISPAPSSIFGSTNAGNLTLIVSGLTPDKGHLRIVFDNAAVPGFQNTVTSVDGDVYNGLPVTGFWAANYVNSAAQPGKLANYSGAVHHRGARNIVGS